MSRLRRARTAHAASIPVHSLRTCFLMFSHSWIWCSIATSVGIARWCCCDVRAHTGSKHGTIGHGVTLAGERCARAPNASPPAPRHYLEVWHALSTRTGKQGGERLWVARTCAKTQVWGRESRGERALPLSATPNLLPADEDQSSLEWPEQKRVGSRKKEFRRCVHAIHDEPCSKREAAADKPRWWAVANGDNLRSTE